MGTSVPRKFSADTSLMQKAIFITKQDQQQLQELLDEVALSRPRDRGDLFGLRDELHRAVIVDAHAVPADVITMNSRAELVDLDSGEAAVFTLVFPADAAIEENKISVLAPVGAAMLGYRVGDEFEWTVPAGTRRMRVANVLYQPEAAGVFPG